MHPLKKLYCRAYQACFKVAQPILPYREPKILNDTALIADLLDEKRISSVLIVTDRQITALGLMNRMLAALDAHGIHYAIYDETVPNPTIRNIEGARQMYIDHNCSAIIGFGGGSPIDCAKVTGARIVKPRQSVRKMRGLLHIHKRLPLLIAVPTTAGTGSEVTVAAVITDDERQYKCPINDFSLIPHYAVHDYRVTTGLPRHITATTGIDTLTHAVEAYIGHSTTAYTREMAEKAVTLVVRYLKRAYDDGNDREARENMQYAAYCGGVAFTRSYVGYVHGLAHALGGQYGMPHGLTNAIILPHFLEAYGETCYDRLGRLARKCGIADPDENNVLAARRFIYWIKDMNRAMQIPEYIPSIREEDIPVMAHHADRECNPLYPVPKLMNAKELEIMYYIIMGKPAERQMEYGNQPVDADAAELLPAAQNL